MLGTVDTAALIKAFICGGIINTIVTDIIFMIKMKTSIFRMFRGEGFAVIAYIFSLYGMLWAVSNAIFQMFPR
jgi:hypothetical protein